MSFKKARERDAEQLAEIFLTNHEGLELVLGSTLFETEDGRGKFMAINLDEGYSQMIEFKITEL